VFCPSCGSGVQRPAGAPPAAFPPAPTPVPPPLFAPVAPAAPVAYASPGTVGPSVPLDCASWGSRVLAYIIDNLIVLVLVIPLALLAGALGVGASALSSVSNAGGNVMASSCCCVLALFPVLQIGFGIYNRVFLIARRGYSIGMGVAKIKVVDPWGNLLPQSTCWLRLLVQVLLGMVPVVGILDLLWPLWDQWKQTLHDKVVNSYVINFPQAVAMP